IAREELAGTLPDQRWLGNVGVAIERREILGHRLEGLDRHGTPPASARRGWLIVFQPALRLRDRAMSGKDGVDFGQLLRRELPAQRAQILLDLLRAAEAHERRRDRAMAHGPAEGELGQGLAVAQREAPELFHRRQVLGEMIEAEQGAKEVQAPQSAAFGA